MTNINTILLLKNTYYRCCLVAVKEYIAIENKKFNGIFIPFCQTNIP